MPKDMRTWIEQLDKAGELIRIAEEVDPKKKHGRRFLEVKGQSFAF
jgi:3-polyprenyl-4-hydroxybenzoate decarboxylase